MTNHVRSAFNFQSNNKNARRPVKPRQQWTFVYSPSDCPPQMNSFKEPKLTHFGMDTEFVERKIGRNGFASHWVVGQQPTQYHHLYHQKKDSSGDKHIVPEKKAITNTRTRVTIPANSVITSGHNIRASRIPCSNISPPQYQQQQEPLQQQGQTQPTQSQQYPVNNIITTSLRSEIPTSITRRNSIQEESRAITTQKSSGVEPNPLYTIMYISLVGLNEYQNIEKQYRMNRLRRKRSSLRISELVINQ